MDALSNTEVRIFNILSRAVNRNTNLGTKLQAIVADLALEGTPVNAINARAKLTLTGVVSHAEKVLIGSDVYEFSASYAQTPSAPGNNVVNITPLTEASQTLCINAEVSVDDWVQIGNTRYTFIEGAIEDPGEVHVGADYATSRTNLRAAINGTDGVNSPDPLVTIGVFDVNDVAIVTAIEAGLAGNSIPTTSYFSYDMMNMFNGSTLQGGEQALTNHAKHATQLLNLPYQPTAGDTMTIDDVDYLWVAHNTAEDEGDIDVGTDEKTAQTNMHAAIAGTDGINTVHPTVFVAWYSNQNNMTCFAALIGGTAGNSIETTGIFADGMMNMFIDTTLKGGTDCTAAYACEYLIEEVNAHDSEGVLAEAGTGTTVDFTADVAGVAAAEIGLNTQMANGSFNHGYMYGGVNGTVSRTSQDVRFDSTYLYIVTAANTVSGKNWRRIALGSAF